ncbi:MAG: RNA methyltransferase [Limibacillus sp.]
MRGYFGIGVFGISKPRNLGSLLRSTHAFGGSFFFTIHPAFDAREVKQSDTSDAAKHLPLYVYNSIDEMQLPRNCQLVGVELTDEAIELPSFHHPEAAAYLLGPERGSLTPEILERCDQTIKIPTKFCVNGGVAGAIVMYDRLRAQGGRAGRALSRFSGAPEKAEHVHGGPRLRHLEKNGKP